MCIDSSTHSVPFSSFMREWLYGKQGYYTQAEIGTCGDFYTAVSVSKLFGGAIASYILKLIESNTLTLPLYIIEIGAHRGEMMCDVYDFLHALSDGVLEQSRFFIIEPLEALREKSKPTLGNRPITQVKNFDSIDADAQTSLFFMSNELFDAFACDLVRLEANGERFIACVESTACEADSMDSMDSNKNHAIARKQPPQNYKLVWNPLDTPYELDSTSSHAPHTLQAHYGCVRSFMKRYGLDSNPIQHSSIDSSHIAEVPLEWEQFIASVCELGRKSKAWRFVSFDYANLSQKSISLRGYTHHRVLSFDEIVCHLGELFGRIDLTYNVDFDLLGAIFARFGARKYFYKRLNATLVDFGIITLLEQLATHSPATYESHALQVRNLLSGSMGEKFWGVCFGSE